MKPFGKIGSKLLNIQAGPEKVSGSYAMGVFLATTPFIGMKVFIALVLTTILKWSRLAAVIGVYHNNILTGPLYYSCAFFVGSWLTPNDASLPDISEISAGMFFNALYGSWSLFRTLLVGGLILGIPLSLAAFFLSYMFLSRKNAGTPVVR
jgi:uncharacterized protein